MELTEAKQRLKSAEILLASQPWAIFCTVTRTERPLHVAVSQRLRKLARKQGLWGSRPMLSTLKNAAYGFDEARARSLGGRDGIFLLDRSFRPPNEMMRKIFDRFLDPPDSDATRLAQELEVPLAEFLPVRLVSHQMRLLGVLARQAQADWLVLVDCDRSE